MINNILNSKLSNDICLKIDNLQVNYNTFHGISYVLNSVNLTLESSKLTGLVGETGSGKTVTSRAIMRLIKKPGEIKEGNIYFNSIDLLKLTEAEMNIIRGKEIAMIFQNSRTVLNPVFTIFDQMHFILKKHLNMNRNDSRFKIIDLLTEVGISDPLRRLKNYPFELSTGMCQRILIAMALSCRPKLLIADEPTTGLDVTLEAQILNLIKNLVKEHNTSALLITHDLGVVSETCDYVAVMYAGKIIEWGSTKDVFKNPIHPYTVGLIKSSQALESKKEIYYIKGSIPDLYTKIKGCSFADRCNHAINDCFINNPPTIKRKNNHGAICYLDN